MPNLLANVFLKAGPFEIFHSQKRCVMKQNGKEKDKDNVLHKMFLFMMFNNLKIKPKLQLVLLPNLIYQTMIVL